MKPFMNEDFLLSSETARKLYHQYAEPCPIFDYHCHLSPADIADNIRFRNVGQLFLAGDHYKWRGMSAYGYDNAFIRTSDDYDRFMAYAKAMPMMMGNPLYHWTHLELKRVFGITEPLCEANAQAVWEKANAMLERNDYRARGLIERFHVKVLCTTDDPADTLNDHERIAADTDFHTKVLPAFRPDSAVNCDKPGFAEYIRKLSAVSGLPIRTLDDVTAALDSRVQYFHNHGSRLADHGLDRLPYADVDRRKAEKALRQGLQGDVPDAECAEHYRTAILLGLGESYHRRGWVQQYHISAIRDINTRGYRAFGPNTGFDAIADEPFAARLAKLLDAQDRVDKLPKTILYTLNPTFNYALAAIAGSFQGGTPGKVQFGTAWWFADQLEGMREQMKTLASVGLLSTFVGMLTDSRSFVSYPRHEYFRRLLCDIIGGWVENGEYPNNEETLAGIVRGICYDNAVVYFGIQP
ncbi:MAG: glucuronate isomerase [Eubacteriales bacterium]|nr:glucuronate isomerase [Eubacteriales bacterium]